MLYQNRSNMHVFDIDTKHSAEIVKWVKAQFGPSQPGAWSLIGAGWGSPTIAFHDAEHATLFQLRLSDRILRAT